MPPPAAVIFDFGNTLFAHRPLADTIVQAGERCGSVVERRRAIDLAALVESAAHRPEELTLGRDLDADVWSTRWEVLYSIADEAGAGIGAEVNRLMHRPAEWVPFASTAATLRRLHDGGVKVGVLSNTGWNVRTVLEHHGVARFVDVVALSYEIGVVKPHPAAFVSTCELLGVSPADTLMVGDDVVADVGAVRAGLRTLLLPVAPVGSDNGLGMVGELVTRT